MIWHEKALKSLLHQHRDDRLPHALLVSGSRGIGKVRVLEGLASALLCETPDDSLNACGGCGGCRLRVAGTHPDLLRVELADGKQWVPIDAVRRLCEQLALSASRDGPRVAIIPDADRLTPEASNALLKTLEEPPARRYLLLAAHRLQALPITIISRCQNIPLSMPNRAQVHEWLAAQYADRTASEIDRIVAAHGGAPLAAYAALEQLPAGLSIDELGVDLGAIVSDPLAVAATWHDSHPALRLRLLLEDLMAAAKGASVAELTSSLNYSSLLKLAQQTIATLVLATGNARTDMALDALMLEFASMIEKR